MLFGKNIKLLRKRKKRSQEDVAQEIKIKRSTYSGYENGTSEPSFDTLVKLSNYFRVSIDKLLKIDLNALSEMYLSQLEKGFDIDITGKHLRILATTVNNDDYENIELVPIKAKAGYTNGFADPDFIKVLPTFQLPFLDKNKKYRTFQINGDSMPPVSNGSYVTGEYLQNWNMIKDGLPYIVVTKDDGAVFKMVYNQVAEKQSLQLCSTNPAYEPYNVHVNDVLEIWKFINYISNDLPEPNLNNSNVSATMMNLQREVKEIKNTLREKK